MLKWKKEVLKEVVKLSSSYEESDIENDILKKLYDDGTSPEDAAYQIVYVGVYS